MSELDELYTTLAGLRERLPGFRTITLPEETKSVVAFEITSGGLSGIFVMIREITATADGRVSIDYSAVNAEGADASHIESLGPVVGDVVDFFIIDNAITQLKMDDELTA